MLLRIGVVLCLAAIVVATPPPANSAYGQTLRVLHGELAGDIPVDGSPGDECDDPSGAFEPGRPVALEDEDRMWQISGEMRRGFVDNQNVCSYGFTIWGVPDAPVYYLTAVLARGVDFDRLELSRSFLSSQNWSIRVEVNTAEVLAEIGAPTEPPKPAATVTPATERPDWLLEATATREVDTAGMTSQEEAYMSALMLDTGALVSISERLSSALGEVGISPSVIFDPSWRTRVSGILGEWRIVAERAGTYEPSPRQQHIHDIWLSMSALSLRAIDDMTLSIDNFDPDAMARSTARIEYITLLIQDLTAAVELFYADPGANFDPTHALSPVDSCAAFPSYDEAQMYYAAYPEEQSAVDPDWDGLACEVHFGRG